MEREVTILVFLAIILALALIAFGLLIFRMYFDFEQKKIKVAKQIKIKQLSEERSELAEQFEAESEQQ